MNIFRSYNILTLLWMNVVNLDDHSWPWLEMVYYGWPCLAMIIYLIMHFNHKEGKKQIPWLTLVFCVQKLNALLSYIWGSLTTVGYGFPCLTMIYHVNMSSTTVFLTKLCWIFISPMVMLHYSIHYYVSHIKFSSFGWHSCLWLTIDNLTLWHSS